MRERARGRKCAALEAAASFLSGENAQRTMAPRGTTAKAILGGGG